MTRRRDARAGAGAAATGVGPDMAVPLELLAVACVEVRCLPGDTEVYVSAATRWRDARNAWLDAHGIDYWARERWPIALSRVPRPWSFRYLTDNDPELLAEKLAELELPASWRPS